jgi:hypothetical protein
MVDKTRSRSWSQLCRLCGTDTAAERWTCDIPLWLVVSGRSAQKKSNLNHRIFSENFLEQDMDCASGTARRDTYEPISQMC